MVEGVRLDRYNARRQADAVDAALTNARHSLLALAHYDDTNPEIVVLLADAIGLLVEADTIARARLTEVGL